MAAGKFYLLFLIALVILLGYLSYQIMEPFLVIIAWAIVLFVLFYPLYALIRRLVKNSSIASLLSLLVIIVLVAGPLTYLSILLVQQIGSFATFLAGEKFSLVDFLEHPTFITIMEKIAAFLQMNPEDLQQAIRQEVSHWGMDLIGKMGLGLKNVVSAVIGLFIMGLTIFFLFKEAPILFEKIRQYLPFSEEQKKKIIKQAQDIIVSTMYGGVIIALAQGTIGGLAFFILGISSPVLWGFAMAVASFLPLVGTFIIWFPACVYLYFQGAIGKAIALAIVGAGGISTIDNFLRPIIVGQRTRLPFLIIFFSVLGGIKYFGLIGFVMGPLVLAVFLSILEIFRNMGEASQS
jgi:predicted PurR-regulated permease PerM